LTGSENLSTEVPLLLLEKIKLKKGPTIVFPSYGIWFLHKIDNSKLHYDRFNFQRHKPFNKISEKADKRNFIKKIQ